MSYCGDCGVEIPDGKRLCDNCVRKIVAGRPGYQKQQAMPQPGYYYPQKLSQLPGDGGMILAIISGILILIGSFTLYFAGGGGYSSFLSISNLPGEFGYMWVVLIGGILILIFGILAFVMQNRTMALSPIIFGILAVILPLIFAAHFANYMGISFGNALFWSDSGFYMIYLGGFLSIFGGLLGFLGGWKLWMEVEPPTRYPPQYR